MDKYIGVRLDGRYAIEELVGEGGMANVYRATDVATGNTVAVKILKDEYRGNDELVKRFMNESRAISVLSHPNIVKVFDVSVTDKVYFIVMEYIGGITLKEYIEQRGEPLTYKEVVHFISQELRALQHAHDKGIVHRDIKPQNIMIMEDGGIKVMDFGIARLARSEVHTAEEQAIGSVHYISPEQAQGADTDLRADIYSTGIMMYEMLSGKLPFEDENAVSVAIKQISDEAVPLLQVNPSVPEGLADIVGRAMAKDPRMRYQSALEMLRDIEEFKTNPSIKFEYEYLSEDPARYVNKVMSDPRSAGAAGAARTNGNGKGKKDKKKRRRKRFGFLVPITLGLTIAIVGVCVLYSWDLVQNSPNPLFGEYENIELPSFTGLTEDEVLTTISSAPYNNLRIVFDYKYDPGTKAGVVLTQSPDSDPTQPLTVKANQKVKLVLSQGMQMVTLEDMTVLTKQEAVDYVLGFGLMPYVKTIENETVPPGQVIGSDPEAGLPFENTPGKVVTIYVSGSRRQYEVVVPNLIGLENLEAANKVLDNNNLMIGTVKSEYNEAPEGTIIDQTPLAGTRAMVFDNVHVVISKGPEPASDPTPETEEVAVPSVVGLSLGDAQTVLSAAGFSPRVREVPDAASPGTLLGTDPGALTMYPKGSAVYILVSGGLPPASSSEPSGDDSGTTPGDSSLSGSVSTST